MTIIEDSHIQKIQGDYTVSLPVFEGPLDLLLFLIKKNELDIYDIPIGTITHQYLNLLKSIDLKTLDLDIAGAFCIMASNLMYIKSRMLLPADESMPAFSGEISGPETIHDPRWELVEQLLHYKAYKYKALEIQNLIQKHQDYIPRAYVDVELLLPKSQIQLSPMDTLDIWNAFNQAILSMAERTRVGTIEFEPITISERMEVVLQFLEHTAHFKFSDFKIEKSQPMLIVATFLASLELCRLKKLQLHQENLFEDIFYSRWERLEIEEKSDI